MERSLRLLFALQDGPLTVSEAARRLQVDVPSAARLLATLRRNELVDLTPGAAGFELGPAAARLGSAYLRRHPWAVSMGAGIQALADELGETASLAVLVGRRARYHTRCGEERNPGLLGHVGGPAPWHASSVAKAMLAYMDGDERRAVLAGYDLTPLTSSTITSRAALEAEIEATRRRGHALSLSEFDPGVLAVALPIFGPGSRVVGALAVCGHESRFGPQRRRRALSAIRHLLDRQVAVRS